MSLTSAVMVSSTFYDLKQVRRDLASGRGAAGSYYHNVRKVTLPDRAPNLNIP